MFDIGFSEIVVIAVVALIVLGPERLPKAARTLGHLFGRLQRYVNDVKADISREMELEELRKLQQEMKSAASDLEQSMTSAVKDVETGVREVYWSDDAVLEARDDLSSLLAQAGLPDAPWVAREPDPPGRQLDQTLALLTGLASQQRDNPLLVQQEPGSAFVRTDTLRDTPVVVLRYGTSSVYWLAADDGRMLRFESNNTVGDRPVVVDVLGFREITVDGPPVDQVVDVADIADAYDAALATP